MKKTTHLKITGMTCASCVNHIERELKKTEGVESASLNFATETAKVDHDPQKATEENLVEAVKRAGYQAEVVGGSHDSDSMHNHKGHMPHSTHKGHSMSGEDHSQHVQAESQSHTQLRFRRFAVALGLSVVILALTFVYKIPQGMEVMMILSLIILLYSGREFFQKGIPGLLRGRPGMDTLVALGVGAAFLYSSYNTLFTEHGEEYFMDAAIITTFILLGRYLEAKAKGSASAAIKKLLALSAKVAHRLKTDGSTEDVPLDQIQKGDRLLVKPGEKIPVDGVMEKGDANLNESMITGESIPADKQAGDRVIGATINGNTSFEMRAEKVGSETMLARIIQMVEEAQMSKAPIQKLVDVISGYFVWGVMIISLATFLFWWLAADAGISRALIVTVSVLIIACPCALGLATPISIVVGSGKGANLGILIKNSEALEKVHQITAIAFDKTGTLTQGKPAVQQYQNLGGDEAENLSVALALEDQSEHPLAKSVVEYVKAKKNLRPPEIQDFKAVTGRGVKGKIGGKTYHLGSRAYIKESVGLSEANDQKVFDWQEIGYTVLILADDKNILSLFGVQDGIRETSAEAVQHLKKRGIRTVMLTGDNQKVAYHIANEVGIDEVHASVMPEEKKAVIQALQKEGHFVAMSGDGINDSPAMAQANIAIAMGTGTDVAMETGDLVLVKGDLMKAVEAIELSRATLRNIKQNLFWAFIYNSVGIPVAALGLLNPAFSAGAMAFSSISVVLNALRLKRFRVRV